MTEQAMEHSPREPVHFLACQLLTDECSCYAEVFLAGIILNSLISLLVF